MPTGVRYFGVAIRVPAEQHAAIGLPWTSRLTLLRQAPRVMPDGRMWAPVQTIPPEIIETLDATSGDVLTVVRVAFALTPSAARRAGDGHEVEDRLLRSDTFAPPEVTDSRDTAGIEG